MDDCIPCGSAPAPTPEKQQQRENGVKPEVLDAIKHLLERKELTATHAEFFNFDGSRLCEVVLFGASGLVHDDAFALVTAEGSYPELRVHLAGITRVTLDAAPEPEPLVGQFFHGEQLVLRMYR